MYEGLTTLWKTFLIHSLSFAISLSVMRLGALRHNSAPFIPPFTPPSCIYCLDVGTFDGWYHCQKLSSANWHLWERVIGLKEVVYLGLFFIARWAHSSLTSGHPGETCTQQLIFNRYWWETLKADVCSFLFGLCSM